jgi:hypothetical protein
MAFDPKAILKKVLGDADTAVADATKKGLDEATVDGAATITVDANAGKFSLRNPNGAGVDVTFVPETAAPKPAPPAKGAAT